MTTVDLSKSTITLDLAPPEACPGCAGEMTGIELRLNELGGPSAGRLGVYGSQALALPCRCVVSRSEPKEINVVPSSAAEIPPPPADAPRTWHEWYARAFGYFWMPCPLCGKHFGGHEWMTKSAMTCSIPDSTGSTSTAICPACTTTGRGAHPKDDADE